MSVQEHHWHTPVVEVVQAVVGVYVLQLRLNAKGIQCGQRLITKVTALASHEDDFHGSEASCSGRQVQDLPRFDHRARQAVGPLDVIHAGSYVV